MPRVTYGGQSYECKEQESVLDCMTAHGVTVPSSCHAGLCQTCMMRAVKGKVPQAAQAGLKPTFTAQNYFLACSCYPEEDLDVALPEPGFGKISATVMEVRPLNAEIACVQLLPGMKLNYRSGQFINIYKDAETARSYSLASVPETDEYLQLHVRKVPNGRVSNWVHETLKAGDKIEISEAMGDCFYVPGNADQNILLIGTGSGLAPLYGIIRDALLHEHRAAIKLYHGCETVDVLYLVNELKELSLRFPNFSYTPCISGDMASQNNASLDYTPGMVLDIALADNPELSGWRAFLCGHPQMVATGKKEVFFAGASMRDIYADPFENAPVTTDQVQAPVALAA
jgi:ferredoxin-NADP reductase/ferredoxin